MQDFTDEGNEGPGYWMRPTDAATERPCGSPMPAVSISFPVNRARWQQRSTRAHIVGPTTNPGTPPEIAQMLSMRSKLQVIREADKMNIDRDPSR